MGREQVADKAQADRALQLPAPAIARDDPILAALQRRQTIREISPTPLSLQQLSDLLRSAFGVNREVDPFGAPGRTAGSASNSQEIGAGCGGPHPPPAPPCRHRDGAVHRPRQTPRRTPKGATEPKFTG